MATGFARIGNNVRSFFDMDPAAIARLRAKIEDASFSDPVKDLKAARNEFNSDFTRVIELADEIGFGEMFRQLAKEVEETSQDTDFEALLSAAAEDNARERAGMMPRGGGRVPMALWADARAMARKVDAGIITRKAAVDRLRNIAGDDAAKRSLGTWAGAVKALEEVLVDQNERAVAAKTRLQQRAAEGVIALNDHRARLRVKGTDPAQMLAEGIAEAQRQHAGQLEQLTNALNAITAIVGNLAAAQAAAQQAQAQAHQGPTIVMPTTVKP